jgi:hypothetical protein
VECINLSHDTLKKGGGRFCEHAREPQAATKGAGFIEYVTNSQVLKKLNKLNQPDVTL